MSGMSQIVNAGSIYLTGHDVLLHDGQAGYDNTIVDWLRGEGTGSEIAAADYSISVIGSGVGAWGWTDVPTWGDRGVKPGFQSTTYYDTDLMSNASWTDALSKDLLVILSYSGCGGCDTSATGSAAINARASEIETAFNDGMDIWGLSGDGLGSFYGFLPTGVVASGAPIGGSSGFTATVEGIDIGITNGMINGYATHNRFYGMDSAFTTFENRSSETVSIGIRDVTIVACDPSDPGSSCFSGGSPVPVPEPPTVFLLVAGLVGLAGFRKKFSKK